MTKVLAEALKIGDVIMPPSREVKLWMRREIQSKFLSESALHLTIAEIHEAEPDKGGRWIRIICDHTAEWLEGRDQYSFGFKVRPETPWVRVS